VFVTAFFFVLSVPNTLNPARLFMLLIIYAISIRMAVAEAHRRNGVAFALLKEGDKDGALLVERTGAMTRPSLLLWCSSRSSWRSLSG
jgi:hypothetical protein